MSKSNGNIRAGGFCAVNSGNIEDCYSLVRVDANKKRAGGFISENNGVLHRSFSHIKLSGVSGGFVSGGTGNKNDKSATMENCYFFHNEKEGSKRIHKLVDHDIAQRLSEIESAEDIGRLGFDLEEIWQYTTDEDKQAKKRKSPLVFIPEKWMYDIRCSARLEQYVKIPVGAYAGPEGLPWEELPENAIVRLTLNEVHSSAIEISTAEQLFEFAEHVNKGIPDAVNAYVRLTADIDLGGKEWTPIGKERLKPFTGIFDGEGHTVSNFVIKDKKVENKGFFGFLQGEVYNLSVDCKIKGGLSAGGICAVNNGGIIGCCGAVVSVKGKDGYYGGLCGRNGDDGRIFQSYAAGKLIFFIIPWWYGLPLLLLLIPFVLPQVLPVFNPTPYPPPPYDEDQVPSNDGLTPNADGNFVSFQFEQEVDVNLTTGKCKFNFKNPGNSNHDIIVQLHFTDGQAKRVMGGTGRSAEEQAEIEAAPGYDPETYRTVIAESKAIRPGYQLDELKLVDLQGGAKLPPGEYNAVVYLVFYDLHTHDRAMLESQLPVVITVHE